MIFLSLVHLRDASCTECGAPLAIAGARSFVVADDGEPYPFDPNSEPGAMTVAILCENGHSTTFHVPSQLAAEDTLQTPDDAPIGRDAVVVEIE